MKILIAPHNDDETLFAGFTICAHPDIYVAIVYDSYTQPNRGHAFANREQRRKETVDALDELRGGHHGNLVNFLGVDDFLGTPAELVLALQCLALVPNKHQQLEHLFIPAYADQGHAQHNLVNQAAMQMFPNVPITAYLTYTAAGKQTSARPVAIQHEWVRKKLRALACYTSQHQIENCRPHFLGDLHEYYQER